MTTGVRRTAQVLGSIFAVPCAFLGLLGWIYLVAGPHNSGLPVSTDSPSAQTAWAFPFFLLGVAGWLFWILAVGVVAAAFGVRYEDRQSRFRHHRRHARRCRRNWARRGHDRGPVADRQIRTHPAQVGNRPRRVGPADRTRLGAPGHRDPARGVRPPMPVCGRRTWPGAGTPARCRASTPRSRRAGRRPARRA